MWNLAYRLIRFYTLMLRFRCKMKKVMQYLIGFFLIFVLLFIYIFVNFFNNKDKIKIAIFI